LFFGADPGDYDRTRCAGCARTRLHDRGVVHYPEGCKRCGPEVVKRCEEYASEQRRARAVAK
jgi:hypothetical protein